jgi:hypothetical protein
MKILLTAFFGRQKIEMNSGTNLWEAVFVLLKSKFEIILESALDYNKKNQFYN